MKIKQFLINRFRSIRHLTLKIGNDQLTTIVGENETGKTNLLHALAWWGGDPNIKLTQEDIMDENAEIISNKLALVSAELEITLEELRILDPQMDASIVNKVSAETKEMVFARFKQHNLLVNILRTYDGQYRGHKLSYFVDHNWVSVFGKEQDLQFNVTPENLKKIIPRFIYYNVFEEYIEENSIPFAELLTRKGWTNVALILGIDQKEHQKITELILQPAQNYIKIQELERKFTSVFSDKFEIFWHGPRKKLTVSLNSQRIGISCASIDENGQEGKLLKPSQMSAGFRWSFCLNSKLEALTLATADQHCFLLLDEPNTSLSGDQQARVLETFERFVEQGNSIIFSTHSPFLVNLNKRIMIMKKVNEESTISNAANLHGEELLITIRGKLHLTMGNTFFYGKQLLLVEGMTDQGHLELWGSDKLEENDISIMEIGGIRHLPPKLDELEREGMLSRCSIILDCDEAGIRAKNQAKNQLKEKGLHLPITTIEGKDIEDLYSREDFFKICEHFLEEEALRKIEMACPVQLNEIERGRMKEASASIEWDDGAFKLCFLAMARKKSIDNLDQTTKGRFNELIDRIIMYQIET